MCPQFTDLIIVSKQDTVAMDVRCFSVPPSALTLWLFDVDQALKAHPAYAKAKAGDWQCALALVSDVALAGIHSHRDKVGSEVWNELIEILGIAVNALTANEARYLVGFRTADEIRNRLAKAKQEIDLRLRSKGIPSVFGG